MKTMLGLTMAMIAACGGSCGSAEGAEPTGPSCASGVCMAAPAKEKSATAVKEAEITTQGIAALQRAKVPMMLLDARTGKYDDGRRIPGAKALSPAAKEEEVSQMLPDKNALVVTYCANLHCPASAQLAARLRELGYKNVLEDHEGIDGWAAAGLPVETAAKP